MRQRPLRRAFAVSAALSLLTACGDGSRSGEADGEGDTDGLSVRAAFYPLQWITEQIGGSAVSVRSLTPPGAEPHDLELGPQDVAAVGEADLVVYLAAFQPAVDEAVEQEAPDTSFDAAEHAELDLTYTPIEEGTEETEEAGSTDPHFWLDPLRLADVAVALADRLGELDPDNADTFTANVETLRTALEELDTELSQGLASCGSTDLVTSHNAFGYFAEAYGLTQVGITGLTPEEEPSTEDLAEVADFVEENDVRTIYYETLVSPAIADTVAAETGAQTALLDPLEGLTDDSAGSDYLEVMRSNLDSIRAGQPCS
jgi:zinc transport system substrate-binding protein